MLADHVALRESSTHRIHVWYIYSHHKSQPNVGTVNIPYMDPMGYSQSHFGGTKKMLLAISLMWTEEMADWPFGPKEQSQQKLQKEPESLPSRERSHIPPNGKRKHGCGLVPRRVRIGCWFSCKWFGLPP